jgi:general secretion pathway protein C
VVGDQIVPGVTLKEVAYDHVVIDRGSAPETLFLDQSANGGSSDGEGAGASSASGAAPVPAEGGDGASLTSAMIGRDVAFAPRTDGGRVTGIVVTARNDGQGFAKAGFLPGDIVTQINGKPITSAGDLNGLQAQLRPGARLSLMVERGAATVPVAVTMSGGQ